MAKGLMNDRFSPDDLPTSGTGSPARPVRAVDLAHIRPFRIGSVEVRPATLEMVDGGRRELLEPRVMQVLVALAGARGEILSRDDLIAACWEGRAVSDDAINRVLSRLRALARTYGGFEIETITKVGYRLVAGPDPEPEVTADRSSAVPRRTVIAGGLAVAAAGAGGWFAWSRYARPREASIAVLPFANLSGDPGRQYFADGMAEELRTALARINRLKVIGRTSSESVRHLDARTAANTLGVANVLIGSIRQSAATVRVSAQLVDGSDGVALWSETYDRAPGDILTIQTDIARSVAQALVHRLARDENAALTAGGTTSVAAHDLMLQGLALDASSDSEEVQRRVLGYMDAAIALDPRYADAHATRALRLSQIANYYVASIAAGRSMNREAIRAARNGVQLAPNLASSRSALGWALQYDLDFAGAERELVRAYQLGRGDARTLRIYATFLWRMGRSGQAEKVAAEAGALDPLHPRHQQMIAQIHMAAARYGDAARTARATLQTAPSRLESRWLLANSLVQLGLYQDARSELGKLPEGNLRRTVTEAILKDRISDRAGSDRIAAEMVDRHGDVARYELAQVYAQRGDANRALAELDLAFESRDPDLARIAGDRLFDPISKEPGFGRLLREIGLEDYWRRTGTQPDYRRTA